MIKHCGDILLGKGVIGIAHQKTRFAHRTVSHHNAFQHDSAGSVCHDDPDLTTTIIIPGTRRPVVPTSSSCSSCCCWAVIPARRAGITSVGGGLRGARSRAGTASFSPPPPPPPPRGTPRISPCRSSPYSRAVGGALSHRSCRYGFQETR